MPGGGVKLVLGDPETPMYRSGYYATTDCDSVFWTDWQFLLIKPSASNRTSGLLKSAWVIIHCMQDSLLIGAGVSLSTMLVCFRITKVLILDTRSWANLIFVSPCGDVDTPTTLYVFASILLLALLSLVVVIMTCCYWCMHKHTLLMYIIASMTKQSSELVLALSNKSVLNQWVTEGALPKLWGLASHSVLSEYLRG